MAFVERVAQQGSPEFVPPAERFATFDNDGTPWAEQPMYFQALFVFDRIKSLASQHLEGKDKEPFASCSGATRGPHWPVASTLCSKWPWPPMPA